MFPVESTHSCDAPKFSASESPPRMKMKEVAHQGTLKGGRRDAWQPNINKLPNQVSVDNQGEWSPSPELAFPAIACRLRPLSANAVRPSSLQDIASLSPITNSQRKSVCVAWAPRLQLLLCPFRSRPNITFLTATGFGATIHYLPYFWPNRPPYQALADFGIWSQLVAFFLSPFIASHYK